MDQNHGKPTLDLGLSAILESAKAEPARASEPAAEAVIPAPRFEPPPVIIRDEFETLADKGEWSALLKLCEDKISRNGADLTQPRLWWITSHLRTNGLPVSFLTAPLEAATKDLSVKSEEKFRVLASSTLAATAGALEKSGDGIGAVSLLERAITLGGKQERELAGMIDREIVKLRELSGLSTKQLEERNAKIKKLQNARPKGIQGAVERTLASVERKAPRKQSARAKPQAAADPSAGRFPFFNSKFGVRAGCGALIALLLLWGGRHLWPGLASDIGTPSLDGHAAGTAPELKLAEISRIENVSAFDGLYYDLKDNVDGQHKVAQRAIARVSDAVGPRVPRDKETLNLSEPRESAEMQQALQQPDKSAVDSNAEILFGGAGAAKSSPVSVVSSTGSTPRNQSFSGAKIFKILAPTKILSKPSYQTDVIGTLNPGERVSAEAKVDSWLQIRSVKTGRIGFIFAQDAEPDA